MVGDIGWEAFRPRSSSQACNIQIIKLEHPIAAVPSYGPAKSITQDGFHLAR